MDLAQWRGRAAGVSRLVRWHACRPSFLRPSPRIGGLATASHLWTAANWHSTLCDMIKRIVPLALLCLILIGGLLYSQRRTGPLKVSGFLESDEIRVGSRVGGRGQKILVQGGDKVNKGQPLVGLEPFNLSEQRS